MKNNCEAEVLAKQLHEEEQFNIQRILQDDRDRKTRKTLKEERKLNRFWIGVALLVLLPILYTKWNENHLSYGAGIVSIRQQTSGSEDVMVYAQMEKFSRRPGTFSARYTNYDIAKVALPDGRIVDTYQCNLSAKDENYSGSCNGEYYDEEGVPTEFFEWDVTLVTFPLEREVACDLPVMEESDNLYCAD